MICKRKKIILKALTGLTDLSPGGMSWNRGIMGQTILYRKVSFVELDSGNYSSHYPFWKSFFCIKQLRK